MKHNELHLLPTSPATLANSKGPSYGFDAEEEEEVPSSTYVPWPFRYPCSTEIGSPGTTRVELDITSRTMVYNCDHFNLLLLFHVFITSHKMFLCSAIAISNMICCHDFCRIFVGSDETFYTIRMLCMCQYMCLNVLLYYF